MDLKYKNKEYQKNYNKSNIDNLKIKKIYILKTKFKTVYINLKNKIKALF